MHSCHRRLLLVPLLVFLFRLVSEAQIGTVAALHGVIVATLLCCPRAIRIVQMLAFIVATACYPMAGMSRFHPEGAPWQPPCVSHHSTGSMGEARAQPPIRSAGSHELVNFNAKNWKGRTSRSHRRTCVMGDSVGDLLGAR